MVDTSLDLKPGDFLYQSDQELFLVLAEENDETFTFAVHGWREIDKDRVEEYVDGRNGKLHKQEHVDEIVVEEADDDTIENYERLYELFYQYNEDISDEDVVDQFKMGGDDE